MGHGHTHAQRDVALSSFPDDVVPQTSRALPGPDALAGTPYSRRPSWCARVHRRHLTDAAHERTGGREQASRVRRGRARDKTPEGMAVVVPLTGSSPGFFVLVGEIGTSLVALAIMSGSTRRRRIGVPRGRYGVRERRRSRATSEEVAPSCFSTTSSPDPARASCALVTGTAAPRRPPAAGRPRVTLAVAWTVPAPRRSAPAAAERARSTHVDVALTAQAELTWSPLAEKHATAGPTARVVHSSRIAKLPHHALGSGEPRIRPPGSPRFAASTPSQRSESAAGSRKPATPGRDRTAATSAYRDPECPAVVFECAGRGGGDESGHFWSPSRRSPAQGRDQLSTIRPVAAAVGRSSSRA